MSKSFESLQANAVGVLDNRYPNVVHFRGIKYASIAERFASPRLLKRSKNQKLQALNYGPRCPHPPTDVREVMQIPRNLLMNDPDTEDELECCNLNISCPTNIKPGSIPVLVWLYGGAQVVSYPTASQRLGDTGPLVAQAIEMRKPILLVTLNYRLNVFAYGDGSGEKNLALADQRIAMQWISENIFDFGGDVNNITLAGESAGGIYSHALIASGTKVNRIILASGNLYTSDPKPPRVGKLVCDAVVQRANKIESKKHGNTDPKLSLKDIPAQTMVQALVDLGITQMSLQEDSRIQGWEENDVEVFQGLDGVMIGECEFESILWLFGARVFPEAAVAAQFETTPPEPGQRVAKIYLTNPQISDPKLGMVKSGGLDFVTDAHFAYPSYAMAKDLREAYNKTGKGPRVYQYIFDEKTPWGRQGSSTNRAHHAVDLLAIFGGYDQDFPGGQDAPMIKVGRQLRANWIDFVNGPAQGKPWNPDRVYAYGPDGHVGELTEQEYRRRRRTEHFAVLKDVGRHVYDSIWTKLAGAADVVLAQAQTQTRGPEKGVKKAMTAKGESKL